MGFPTYTEEQRAEIRTYFSPEVKEGNGPDAFEKFQLHFAYYKLYTNVNTYLKKTGLDPTKEDGFKAILQQGLFRDGDGSLLPEDWKLEDLLLYMTEKDIALAKKAQADPKNAETERSFMFLLRQMDETTNQLSDSFTRLSCDFFNEEGKPLPIKERSFSEYEEKISVAKVESQVAAAKAEPLDAATVNTFKEAIRVLRKDLMRMDSIFSSDSQEYRNFSRSLSELSRKLSDNSIQSPQDLIDAFDAADNSGQSVFDYARAYKSSKMGLDEKLSDRQMGRLSIISRLSAIRSELTNAAAVTDNAGLETIQNNILLDTVAQKAMLGSLKSIGTPDARKTYGSDRSYAERLAVVKASLLNKKTDTLKTLAEEASSTKVAEKLSPGKVKVDAAFKRQQEEAAAVLAGMNKEQVPMTLVAQYLLDRSASMINELDNEVNNATHSDAYKNFRSSLDHLQQAVAGIVVRGQNKPNGFGPQDLSDALQDVYTAAEFYQMQHRDDAPETINTNIIRRLGMASELKYISKFLNTPEERLLGDDVLDPTKMFQALAIHQDTMRTLETTGKLYQTQTRLDGVQSFVNGTNQDPRTKLKDKLTHDFKDLLDDITTGAADYQAKQLLAGRNLSAEEKQQLIENVSKNKGPAERWNSKNTVERLKESLALQDACGENNPRFLGNPETLKTKLATETEMVRGGRGAYATMVVAAMLKAGHSLDDILDENKLLPEKAEFVQSTMEKVNAFNGKAVAETLMEGARKTAEYINNKLCSMKELTMPELAKYENRNLFAAQQLMLNMKQDLESQPKYVGNTGALNEAQTPLNEMFLKGDALKESENFCKMEVKFGNFTGALSKSAGSYVAVNEMTDPMLLDSQHQDRALPFALTSRLCTYIKKNGPSNGKNFIKDFFKIEECYRDALLNAESKVTKAVREASIAEENPVGIDRAYQNHTDQMKAVSNSLWEGKAKIYFGFQEDGQLNAADMVESFNEHVEKVVAKLPKAKTNEKANERAAENEANLLG